MKKIVLVGPVYPYKGGIAHYTSLMCKSLREKYDVTMISFSMQYPKIMYRKEQKDYENNSFEVQDTKYWLNSANPFNILSVAGRIKKINPELIIFQWWHPYFAPCYSILLGRLKSYKIMAMCHNVFPHERFPFDRKLTRHTLKKADYFLTQSQMDYDDLLTIIPDAKVKRVVHPTYNAFKLTGMSKQTARDILKISDDEKILLFFGFVRKYKGLHHIINAMPEIISRNPRCKLYVVGDFGDDRDEYIELITSRNVNDSVVLVEGYCPDKEVEKYFAASDLVVLPYESATQSGIAQIAYGFEKPVVATRVGGLPEVVSDGKTGYVVEPFDSNALADAINEFFRDNKESDFIDNIKEESYRFSWEKFVEEVEQLCSELK